MLKSGGPAPAATVQQADPPSAPLDYTSLVFWNIIIMYTSARYKSMEIVRDKRVHRKWVQMEINLSKKHLHASVET